MGNVRTDGKGQIQRAPQQNGGEASLLGFLQKHSQEFAMVMPKHLNPDRMVRVAMSAVRKTKGLGDCDLGSFASAIMACSVLGLEPNTPLGHAYLIPFKRECQLIIGYKGLVELMYRSGIVSSVQCRAVFDGDKFKYQFGLHPDIQHEPAGNNFDPRKLTHVYPVIKLREQGMDPIWDVLDRDQIEQRRRRSKAGGGGPWSTDYVAMARKTGIRSIATWVPSSVERPHMTALAYESSQERGRPQEAIGALGERAQEALYQLGTFPKEPDPVGDDETESEDYDRETGEVFDKPPSDPAEREPGVD